MKQLTAPRNEFGVDIAKLWAMFSVVSVHFFLYTNYYTFTGDDTEAVIYASVRMLFYQCVPMFLLITGYLKRKTEFCPKHYVKLIPVLVTYLVGALINIAYKIFVQGKSFHPLVLMQSIWGFNQPSYAWYLNVYISVYLLMPFISLAYSGLKTKMQKKLAVIIVIFVTMFASSVNKIPINTDLIKNIGFAPDYFRGMWPLGYYVVGMYINDVKPKINKFLGVFLLAVLLLGEAVIDIATTPDNFKNGVNFVNQDCVNVPIVTLMFLLLYDIKCENIPIRRLAAKVSSVSLTFLVISFMGDAHFYPKYKAECHTYSDLPEVYLKVIPLHFFCAVMLSLFVNELISPISKLIMKPLLKCCERAGSSSEIPFPTAAEKQE